MGLRFIFVICQFHAALPGVFRVRSQFRHVAICLFGPFRIGVVLGLPERPEIVCWCLRFSSPLVYRARPFYLCLVRHSQDYLCPVSSVANVESNEIRLEIIDISGHILPALFSIRFTLVSHYSAFSSVRRTDVNVLNSLKHSRLSCERRRKQNNAILEGGDWRIMRGECDPKYRYSLFVSHYSLQSPQ